ncbi:MAG: BrnA antitoxin family protein [Betaproteobacteria bacterium]|nr:MAG: BrnA antitoxin family protein [Betaproteobacteria bacterium]
MTGHSSSLVRRNLCKEFAFRSLDLALRVDADVLEWFKAQGPGYQSERAEQGTAAPDHCRSTRSRHPSVDQPCPNVR